MLHLTQPIRQGYRCAISELTIPPFGSIVPDPRDQRILRSILSQTPFRKLSSMNKWEEGRMKGEIDVLKVSSLLC